MPKQQLQQHGQRDVHLQRWLWRVGVREEFDVHIVRRGLLRRRCSVSFGLHLQQRS